MVEVANEMKIIVKDEMETEALGNKIGDLHQPGLTVTLEGQIGAGKTTFVRGFLRSLGYDGHVKSPTFTLIEYYEFESFDLFHLDLFRVEDVRELNYFGLDLSSKAQTTYLVEWPKFDLNFVSKVDINVTFDVLESGREAIFTVFTQQGKELLSNLRF